MEENGKRYISWSQIETGRCMLKYKRMYVDGEYQESSRAQEEGSLVHDLIFEYSRECIRQQHDGDYELVTELVDRRFKESGLPMDRYKDVREVVLRYAERGFRYEYMKDFEREGMVSLGPDGKGGEILVKFRIDRIDAADTPDGPCIYTIDYKNQLNLLTETELLKHEQLALYDYINCRHLHPTYPLHQRGIYFTRYGTMRWAGPVQTQGESVEAFDATEAWLRMQWDRIVYPENYEPTVGAQCFQYGGCPVMEECPMWSAKQVEEYRSGHTIKDKTRLVRRLDHQKKMALDELKELIPGDQVVEVDGQSVGYETLEGYKYSQRVFEVAAKDDVDLDRIQLGKMEVEKAFKKKMGYIPEELEDYREYYTQRRFVL